jgi:hypothetical protein
MVPGDRSFDAGEDAARNSNQFAGPQPSLIRRLCRYDIQLAKAAG